jgi:hypothetical protein
MSGFFNSSAALHRPAAPFCRNSPVPSHEIPAREQMCSRAVLSALDFATGRVSAMTMFSGQCLCGQVQISVRGEPLRVGICHCTNCRKESGSAFTFYAVWPAHQFEHVGETSEFRGRHFCPRCGAELFSADDREAEIKLGILSEAPTPFVPSYELWIKRREPWLRPIEGAEQYEENRK